MVGFSTPCSKGLCLLHGGAEPTTGPFAASPAPRVQAACDVVAASHQHQYTCSCFQAVQGCPAPGGNPSFVWEHPLLAELMSLNSANMLLGSCGNGGTSEACLAWTAQVECSAWTARVERSAAMHVGHHQRGPSNACFISLDALDGYLAGAARWEGEQVHAIAVCHRKRCPVSSQAACHIPCLS